MDASLRFVCTVPKVSFVIPARNEEAFIVDCLQALTSRESGFTSEIIVVDNGSRDATALLAASAGARVVGEPRPGLAHARQAGLVAARGEILIYVDADTRLTPGWASEIVRQFDADPQLSAVSSVFAFHDGRPIDVVANAIFQTVVMPTTSAILRAIGKPDVLIGAAIAVRAAVLRDAGGIDPRFQFYGEDTMIASTMRGRGTVRYLPRPIFLTSARRYQQKGLLLVVSRYFAMFVLIQTGRMGLAQRLARRFQEADRRWATRKEEVTPPVAVLPRPSLTDDWHTTLPATVLEERMAAGEP